ncbi:MAG: GNAT family N-acetyltransferase [Arcticibacter sp.]
MLELVKCDRVYWDFVRDLRNDVRVSEAFINQTFISPEMQDKYMSENSMFYRIALFNGAPAGYIGVIDDDIRVCTHPDFQRMGVAKFMLQSAFEIWPSAMAKIKINNNASLNLFKSCGFEIEYFLLGRSNNDKQKS